MIAPQTRRYFELIQQAIIQLAETQSLSLIESSAIFFEQTIFISHSMGQMHVEQIMGMMGNWLKKAEGINQEEFQKLLNLSHHVSFAGAGNLSVSPQIPLLPTTGILYPADPRLVIGTRTTAQFSSRELQAVHLLNPGTDYLKIDRPRGTFYLFHMRWVHSGSLLSPHAPAGRDYE